MTKSHTDRQWEKWAEQNPYHGILGVETSSIEEAGNLEAFQRSGEELVAERLGNVVSLFPGWTSRGVALDFGCGAGRLSLPLATRFDRVIGVDVAEPMLVLARKHAQEKGFANIQFVQSVAEAVKIDGGFDFLNSAIVLQHLRPPQGLEIIRQMVQALRPGGAFALHVLLKDNRSARPLLNFIRYRVPPLQWAYALAKGRPWHEPVTEMNPYPIWDLLQVFSDAVPAVAVAPFAQSGNYGAGVLYGRRP